MARGTPRKDSSPPSPSPFPSHLQWFLFVGRMFLASPSPAQPQVCIHGGGGEGVHGHAVRRTHRAHQLPRPLPGQEEWGPPGQLSVTVLSGNTNSLNVSLPCHKGPSPRVRPEEEEKETNVQLIL